MKLISKHPDTAYLEEMRQRLESRGIPAVVQGQSMARLLVPVGATEPTLWVYLPYQEDDAKALLDNPEHMVEQPVDVDEFYLLTQSDMAQDQLRSAALKKMLTISFGLLAALVAGIVLLRVIDTW